MFRRLIGQRTRLWRRYRLLILVLAGLAILDLLVAAHKHVWRSYSPAEYTEKVRACHHARPQLLIVGGSPVTEGIDPEALRGLPWQGQRLERVFSLGLTGATTSEVWHAIEHGTARPPQLLIYGISATDLNESRNEPRGPAELMTWRDLREWRRLRPKSNEWVTRHFLLYRLNHAWQLFNYRHGIRLWAAHHFGALAPDAATEGQKNLALVEQFRHGNGYTPDEGTVNRHYDEMKASGWVQGNFYYLEKFELGHLKYMQRMLDWARSRQVAVVFVEMPVTQDLENRFPAVYKEYRAWLVQFEREQGIHVLRAHRDAVGLNDHHFADLIHLNGAGAQLVSHWLRRQLEDLR